MQGLEHADELAEKHRFDQKRIGPEFVGAIDIADFIRTAQDHDLQVCELRLLTEPLEHFKAVLARHFQVQQEQTGQGVAAAVGVFAVAVQIGDDFLAVIDDRKWIGEPGVPCGTAEHDDVVFVVFRQQNGCFPRNHSPAD